MYSRQHADILGQYKNVDDLNNLRKWKKVYVPDGPLNDLINLPLLKLAVLELLLGSLLLIGKFIHYFADMDV